MDSAGARKKRGSRFSAPGALVILSLLVARDAPARGAVEARGCVETPLFAAARPARTTHWTDGLEPIDVMNVTARTTARIRLYARDGEVDETARADLERVASNDPEPHPLAVRVEQLVMKAAYHFDAARVLVVSGWRENAGRHGTGDAVDFKLQGVPAALLAAYLRKLARVGVGVYTHPRTQFVHLDVREESYHWLDASPPGVKWREWQLRDPHGKERDASWTEEGDLPL
jgi:uncharacterized protein YcbK (DUF882 family)